MSGQLSTPLARPVVLIGPMAVGKSAVGAALARLLSVPFTDSDQVIAAQFGPIPQVFARHGESGFREREAAVIAELLSPGTPMVISLGGGAVLSDATAALLATPQVVYLTADRAAMRRRLSSAAERPLLDAGIAPDASREQRTAIRLRRWREILAQREQRYQSLADYQVDVSRGGPAAGARRVAELLSEHDGAGPGEPRRSGSGKETRAETLASEKPASETRAVKEAQ